MFEIGSSLRDARVRKGLDLTELELETKIRAKYLRALEEEHFEVLPGDTYVKGFLRIYAERLGLDGQLYVDEYNSRFSLGDEPVLATRPRRRAHQRRFEAHAVLVALAAIIAVTVLVIAAWQFGTGGSDDVVPRDATSAVATPAGGTTQASAAENSPVEVAVAARRGSSRAEIRRESATGKLLFEGTLGKGEALTFRGGRIWIRVSNPANVVVNGNSLDELGPGPVAVLVTPLGVESAARAG